MTPNPPAAATIAVTRGEGRIGVFRAMTVLVDGRKAASVPTGNRVVPTVPARYQRVSARMDWARSPDLAVEVSEDSGIAVSFPLVSRLVNLVVHPHPGDRHHRRGVTDPVRRRGAAATRFLLPSLRSPRLWRAFASRLGLLLGVVTRALAVRPLPEGGPRTGRPAVGRGPVRLGPHYRGVRAT